MMIEWNIVNWITVVVMVALALAIFGAVASFVRGNLPGAASA